MHGVINKNIPMFKCLISIYKDKQYYIQIKIYPLTMGTSQWKAIHMSSTIKIHIT